MAKEKRSNKWTFILYQDSSPDNYLEELENLHIPYILSPWHDKDVNKKTGEFKKNHRHGALFFDSLKSYKQVSSLLKDKLNTPEHVEIVMSPRGLYDYFIHAENPDKTLYSIDDIEYGCRFELDKFLIDNNKDDYIANIIDVIDEHNFSEFENLVQYARQNDIKLLNLIMEKTYFFTKYLDSKRHNPHGREAYNNE